VDPAGEGGDGGGAAQGNPGAPGDVAVFEERGVTYASFRDGSAQQVCVEQGLCTLAPPNVIEGSYSDPTQCPIESMDYSPPAYPDPSQPDAVGRLVFREGATVTVNVSCARFSGSENGGTENGGTGTGGTENGGAGTGGTENGGAGTGGTETGGTSGEGAAPGAGDQPQG
jgi:hypothetical protein